VHAERTMALVMDPESRMAFCDHDDGNKYVESIGLIK
jgi:hypothetical protein